MKSRIYALTFFVLCFILGALSSPVKARAFSVFDTTSLGDIHEAEPVKTYASTPSINDFLSRLESTTTIPTVCVYTKDAAEVVSRDTYVECSVYTVNCDDKYRLSGVTGGIRVRGNSTAYDGNVEMIRKNQVPYRIKFDKKQPMFGLNSGAQCKSWVLVKAEYDLLKNDIAFRLGRCILREGSYCSDGIPAHMYLNGKFMGIYELCEQNQVNKNRVNVSEPEKDYTGTDIGYLVEIDNYSEKPYFWMNYAGSSCTDINGVRKKFKSVTYSVKNDVYSDDQVKFIQKYVAGCFKILYEACENKNYYVFDENYDLVKAGKKLLRQKDEKTGEPLDPAEIVCSMAVDLDSIVDTYLVYEISVSRDVGEGSFYMCADFQDPHNIKKLTFTCPWDFEWAFTGSTSGYYAGIFNSEEFAKLYEERSNPWYILLIKQDWFRRMVSRRWQELRDTSSGHPVNAIDKCIKQEKKLLKKYKTDLTKKGSGSYKSAESLIKWVENRILWMDKVWLEK